MLFTPANIHGRTNCVYVKDLSIYDGIKILNTLHGKFFYRYHVTAKYISEEIYIQKFPDSVHFNQPMMPTWFGWSPAKDTRTVKPGFFAVSPQNIFEIWQRFSEDWPKQGHER